MNELSELRYSLESHPVDEEYLQALHRAMAKVATETWRLRANEAWCYVEPPSHCRRLQGWKLHVSTTLPEAAQTLERAAMVLLAEQAAFKFARSTSLVEELNSPRCPRGNSGKFITVYPDDDNHFRLLAEALHRATEGMVGPAILSDRPYRPGGVVHYRYGGFRANDVLNSDGSYSPMLVAPDGTWIKDDREAWFSPPEWAPRPFEDMPEPRPADRRGGPVKLADRYVVRKAIRHSNRGGVYRAEDTATDATVVIKQARPHVGVDPSGETAQDRLRYEARMLEQFEPHGFTPRKLALFAQSDHIFLVQEEIQGQPLRHWVEERSRQRDGGLLAADEVLDVARQLAAAVATIHGANLVLRDLSPGNVIIEDDGRVRLIDVEFFAGPGDMVPRVYTPGYGAPEVVRTASWGPASGYPADLYSLGATLLYLASCMEPYLHADEAPGRTVGDRIATILAVALPQSEAARQLAPLIGGLLTEQPGMRWTIDRVIDFLDDPGQAVPDVRVPEPAGRASEDVVRLLVDDGTAYIVDAMRPDQPHLWPPMEALGVTNDPCNVQAGAGGVVAYLARAAGTPAASDLRPGLAVASRWLAARLRDDTRVLPGLYFGRSGAAWALHSAGAALDNPDLVAQAARYAKLAPVRWPNPDMTHGTAGLGMAQLYFWSATQDPDFRQRAKAAADGLADAVVTGPDGVRWMVPESFDSALAGLTHFGYAHGVAGMCHFLLVAAHALNDDRYLELARAGGDLLASVVEWEGPAALWPSGDAAKREAGIDPGITWWCSGSAGVGAFLLRLWRSTGDARYEELLRGAAVALRRDKWFLTPVACHGLASSGELLLDMAAAFGDDTYREWAEEIAACIHARNVYHRGRMVVPGESGRDITIGFNVGLAGVLAFLHRLRNGGERMWMLDGLLPDQTPERRK
ncbi:class IV lanthionine synthetase LanL [Micromonospora sp. AB353]|uniref:class IV lanthionine synthetase LanL n=1 Tax=Micromonospora sp. AB353 TaxID=3413282 RepID=UPI003C170EC8